MSRASSCPMPPFNSLANSALGTTKQEVADPSPRTEPSVETPKENAVEA